MTGQGWGVRVWGRRRGGGGGSVSSYGVKRLHWPGTDKFSVVAQPQLGRQAQAHTSLFCWAAVALVGMELGHQLINLQQQGTSQWE